jgi:hypothetical protein
MFRHTASVEIDYVDYSAARTFMTAIDEWLQTVPRTPENKFLRCVQANSHWIPRIARLITIIIVSIFIMDVAPHFVGGAQTTFLQFGRFVLCSGVGISAAYMLALWSATYAERSVDYWSEVSYIKFDRGDEIAIDKNSRANRKNLFKSVLGVTGTALVNIIAKVIAAVAVAMAHL